MGWATARNSRWTRTPGSSRRAAPGASCCSTAMLEVPVQPGPRRSESSLMAFAFHVGRPRRSDLSVALPLVPDVSYQPTADRRRDPTDVDQRLGSWTDGTRRGTLESSGLCSNTLSPTGAAPLTI